MADDGLKALIVKPTFDLRKPDSGAEKVLSRVASDALTIARGLEIADTSARIRVGKYEFRQSDYQQIAIWAQDTGKSPEELVSLLEKQEGKYNKFYAFIIDDGSIKQVSFPINLIFLERVHQISHLPKLVSLNCVGRELAAIKFLIFSRLEELYCGKNGLTELDLSNVPALTLLYCHENQFTVLDLSNVPALKKLSCDGNKFTELDLSSIPLLTDLPVC